jgi:hypothetical protein
VQLFPIESKDYATQFHALAKNVLDLQRGREKGAFINAVALSANA